MKKHNKLSAKHHSLAHYLLVVIEYFIRGLVNSLLWLVIGYIGLLIFQQKKSPFDLLIGLPLILISIGFIGNDMQSAFLSILSPKYNSGVCRLCN